MSSLLCLKKCCSLEWKLDSLIESFFAAHLDSLDLFMPTRIQNNNSLHFSYFLHLDTKYTQGYKN